MPTFDQLPCPVVVTNQAGLVLSVNQDLLRLVGGTSDTWLQQPMELMFPLSSRIFMQTHIWPMLFRDQQVREIRLQIYDQARRQVPVFTNCHKSTEDGVDLYTWVFFVTLERSRYEKELLEARKRAELAAQALTLSERFIRTVADAMPSLIGYWDRNLQCQFANKPYQDWFGKTSAQIVGTPIAKLIGASMLAKNWSHIQRVLAGEPQEFERELVNADGSIVHTLINYVPDLDEQGLVKGFFALIANVSRLKEADAAIRMTASVFDAMAEGVMVTNTQGDIMAVNPAFSQITGYSSEEAIGQNARLLKSGRHNRGFFVALFQELAARNAWQGEVWSKRKDNTDYLEWLSISTIRNDAGEIVRYVGVFSDITDRWKQEQVIRHIALHDGLTGLPNRALLMERLGHLITMAQRAPRPMALMFLDLDGFKAVNDTLGHQVGDQVLNTVSVRLKELLRASDTVARLGGDEFVILLDNPENQEGVTLIATRVIEAVNRPIDLPNQKAHVGVTVGIALYPAHGTSSDALLKSADDAMYTAKALGKNRFCFAG